MTSMTPPPPFGSRLLDYMCKVYRRQVKQLKSIMELELIWYNVGFYFWYYKLLELATCSHSLTFDVPRIY